ncbi:MAG: hypothetical protein IPK67_05915 [Planctomycetes bacterium]|nr:hypothetical protein [Planctomycetota bacterium]
MKLPASKLCAHRLPAPARAGALLGLVLLAAACTTTDPAAGEDRTLPTPEEPRAWTGDFQQKSILIADEVSIEGPAGLRDHVAVKQLPEQKYSAKATADGFLQEISVGDNAANPIWIQVDNLAINAVVRARVLERVGDGPVIVRARGNVTWKNLETGASQDSAQFELVGKRPE